MKKNLFREIYLLVLHAGFGGWYFLRSFLMNQPIDGSYAVFFVTLIALPILSLIHVKNKYFYIQMQNIIDGVFLVTFFTMLVSGFFEPLPILIGFALLIPSFIFGSQIQKEMRSK
jgi:hypothetical protein